MGLTEYKDHFKQKIVDSIDKFMEEHGHEYVTPTPLETPEIQMKRLREQLISRVTYEEHSLEEGLQLIIDMLPQFITRDEWDEVCWELACVEANALEYLEDNTKNSDSTEQELVSVDHALGLSEKTYQHLRHLLFRLVENEDYDRAIELSKVLMAIWHNRYPGWVGYARCQSLKGNDLLAIEVYKNVHNMFPKDAVSRIFCSWSYVNIDELELAKEQLQEGEKLLREEPEVANLWRPVINDIKEAIQSRETEDSSE